MTGYGQGHAASRDLEVDVHLSSVNRKQFDARVNLPRGLLALESRVVKTIRRQVRRGQVTGTVRLHATDTARRHGVVVDTSLAGVYIRALQKSARALGIPDDVTTSSMIRLPEVVRYEAEEESGEHAWRPIRKALRMALEQLVETRRREGAMLERDILRRMARLAKRREQILELAPGVARRHTRSLRTRLKQAGVDLKEADPALMRELALFADRVDISEELVRLESHFLQVADIVEGKGPAGRALDFLCQEMHREINTVGSKASDARIAAQVICFKNELEIVREQVQNVE